MAARPFADHIFIMCQDTSSKYNKTHYKDMCGQSSGDIYFPVYQNNSTLIYSKSGVFECYVDIIDIEHIHKRLNSS